MNTACVLVFSVSCTQSAGSATKCSFSCARKLTRAASYLRRPPRPSPCVSRNHSSVANLAASRVLRRLTPEGMVLGRCACGGRGIRFCARWLEPNGKGFRNFLDDTGPCPRKDARPQGRGGQLRTGELPLGRWQRTRPRIAAACSSSMAIYGL